MREVEVVFGILARPAFCRDYCVPRMVNDG